VNGGAFGQCRGRTGFSVLTFEMQRIPIPGLTESTYRVISRLSGRQRAPGTESPNAFPFAPTSQRSNPFHRLMFWLVFALVLATISEPPDSPKRERRVSDGTSNVYPERDMECQHVTFLDSVG
jgi:hypothetical protein